MNWHICLSVLTLGIIKAFELAVPVHVEKVLQIGLLAKLERAVYDSSTNGDFLIASGFNSVQLLMVRQEYNCVAYKIIYKIIQVSW